MKEQVINPDLEFVKEVIDAGGETLKKCFQCATCSVVCNVTPDDKPFPRKEMLQAQWGLKDELFANPDIWLCHQCSDCTAHCPRGAKPGEVLGAVRKLSLQEYSSPSFLGKMVADPKFLIALVAVPLAIFLGILAKLGHLNMANIKPGHDGGIVYANFIPVPYIDVVFILAASFAGFTFLRGVLKYWERLKSGAQKQPDGDLSINLAVALKEILFHERFDKCTVTEARKTSHMFVLFSFIGLAITTTWAIAYLYGNEFLGIQPMYGLHFGESPYPLTDPMKILGNLSAIALLVGITLVILNRMNNAEKAGMGSYYDWLFIGVVSAIVVTGVMSEVLRLSNIAALAYPTYLIHLSSVFFLFAYAPFSKMAHMVYRTTAMVFAKMADRK